MMNNLILLYVIAQMLSFPNLIKWRTTWWESSIENIVHNIVGSIMNYDRNFPTFAY
jgi:hypothetical protein